MNVHQISNPPSQTLARALAEFEAPFTYPLGPGKLFRVSHGEDYTLFFRVQGEGACFIAEHEGRVVGTLGTAIRRLWMPDGTERPAVYIGDLKIAAKARGGTVLIRLARAAETWLRPRVAAGLGVVMGGTPLTPDAYTGRARIPGFQDLGRLMILRICGSVDGRPADPGRCLTTRKIGLACYRRLSLGRYSCPTDKAEQRSRIVPIWLMNTDGSACGMLEDTRRAKRLINEDGSEILSAHLSCFAYGVVSAGAELIGVALQHAARLGLPSLFVAVAEPDARELLAALCDVAVAAPATVYGVGLQAGLWNINSSEI